MNKLIVDGLGKRYELGAEPDETRPLRTFRRLAQKLAGRAQDDPAPSREFWALRNVSFTLEPGTVLGLIGPNGAGKTTLLKILARVIAPTEGRVMGSGRVVSLLELGAGFDPDLTARDNIYLNAAMLGVPKSVVARRFDHIIEFAEVEKFVDTPLKHYSSGMYLRIAFSVAINMEPSILLADEILAVGDQSFQERCLQRVKQEAERGLTVLFVSHDMEAIVRVCNRTLWLNGGSIMALGGSDEVVAEYQNSVWAGGTTDEERGRHANRFAVLHDVSIVTEDRREVRGMQTDEMTFLRLRFELLETQLCVQVAYDVRARGQLVFRTIDPLAPRVFRNEGMWEALMRLPADFFNEMTYSVVPSLTVSREGDGRRQYTLMGEPLSFIVYSKDGAPARDRIEKKGVQARGFLTPRFRWKFQQLVDQPEEQVEADVIRF
jgi:lipopolysaccharide transport system ATP-binding protein